MQNKSVIVRLLVIPLVPSAVAITLFGCGKSLLLLSSSDNGALSLFISVIYFIVVAYIALFYSIFTIRVYLGIMSGKFPLREGVIPALKRSLLLKLS